MGPLNLIKRKLNERKVKKALKHQCESLYVDADVVEDCFLSYVDDEIYVGPDMIETLEMGFHSIENDAQDVDEALIADLIAEIEDSAKRSSPEEVERQFEELCQQAEAEERIDEYKRDIALLKRKLSSIRKDYANPEIKKAMIEKTTKKLIEITELLAKETL